MPLPRSKHRKQLDPRGPLIFDTRTLGPGSARSERRTVSAPAELSVQLVGVPEGAGLGLDVQLEGVAEGVLGTVSVVAPLAGECARCLQPFTSTIRVSFRELFTRDPDRAGPDGYLLAGDLLDLEPALRDALVLELPLSPLCADDCQGLCPQCGIRLADADESHRHDSEAGAWAALRDFRVADGGRRESAVPESAVPESAVPESAVPESAVPESAVPDTEMPGGHPSGIRENNAKEH